MRCIVFAQEHRMNTVQQSAWEDAKDWDPEPLPPPPPREVSTTSPVALAASRVRMFSPIEASSHGDTTLG